MKQITDIENIIKLLTEEPDMVPNPLGTEGEPTDMELTDFQKLMGIKKGALESDVFEDDYYPKYNQIVYEIDDEYIYVDLEKGERDSRYAHEAFGMEDWDFDIMKDMVEDNYYNRDYEPFDCYNANEEWVEGYALTALSPKNMSLLANWFEIVSPDLGQRIKEQLKKDPNVDTRDNHSEWQDLGLKMDESALGGPLVETLLDDYCAAINPAMVNATGKEIRKEWQSQTHRYGAQNWWDENEIVEFQIPLNDMIYIYYKTNRYKGSDTIVEVVESMLEDIGSNFGDMSQWWWESNYYPEFEESYNGYVTSTLEREISKLEDVDNLEKIQEINKKLDDNNIGLREVIKPKGAPYEMKIMKFDPNTLKFEVNVSPVKGYMDRDSEQGSNELVDPVSGEKMGWYTNKRIKMTVDEIINKVINPELKIDGTGYYFPVTYKEEVLKEEKLEKQDREVEINKFIGFCKDELDINELPPVTLRYDKKGGEGNSDITTTAYQSKDQGVHVYIKDRALVDILRSIAHELVHHHQLERDEEYYWKHIEDNPGIQSGTDLEDEANARAGSLIKDWGLVHGNNQIYEGRLIQEHGLHPASFRDRLEFEETELNVEVEVLHKYLNKRRKELQEKFRPLLEDIKFLEYTIEEQVKDGEYKNRDEWWEENTHPMGGSAYDEMAHELEGVEEDLERVGILSDWRTGMNYDINEWLEDLIKEIDDDFYITENGMVELEYLNMGGSPLDEDLTYWGYDGEEIGPVDEGLNDLVYREKPKDKHVKRMEKDWGELTGFPIEKFKNIPPPKNESQETEKELEHLDSILVDDSFVESADDVDQHFKNYLDSKDLDYPLQLIKKYMAGVRSIILKLKYHYNRPRPGQVADAIGMDFNPNSLKSASTPSYPSGHATQGRFIARLLGDVYPEHEEQLMKIGDDIALSRNMAKVHYPSDTKFGQKLGEELYNHISKNTTRPNLNEGRDFESFTKAEVKVMNTIANRFTYDELKEIADNGEFTPSALAKKYISLVKLFGVNNDSKAQAMDYGRMWAKWIVDNWDNHEGTVDSPDFTPLIGTEGVGKAYLDEYEVEGEEDVWEKAYRQGSVYMYGFDDDQVLDYAHEYFYDYDPDMQTVDWGDSDHEDFRIGNVNRLGNSLRLNEQSIDISEIPAEDLSPELEVGDRVYGWDLRDDTLESDMVYPDQVIGNVVSIEQDNRYVTSKEMEDHELNYIYYDIETIDGDNVALYPDDKYIKLPKKKLNEEEVVEDLETKVFRFIRPIDIEKALSQKEIQKVLKSLGLKYNMFDTLDINLENDMVQDLRNQIRFDNFYKRMIAASDIRGGTWEGLFAGLFNGKVVAGQKGVGKADVETPEGGWSLKFVANKNESPTLGSLKTQLQKVKEEGLVPEDATIYGIFSTPDSQTSSELFEAKHQILDSAFEGVNFVAVAYPLPQQNTIIMHFTDMDNLKEYIIDTETPPINKPKSGPEALGELRLSSKGWKSFPFLQITFPEATQEKYQEYLKKYPREQEIEGVFGKYGDKIPPEVLQYLRKNPKSIINRLQKIPGYDKYFTEQFIGSAEYLTQNANERLKSFKKFLTEKCNIKDIPTTIGFRPREAWEDGLMDIFGRCWFKSTPKGVEGGFGNLADKTFEIFPIEEFPIIKEKVDEIFATSKQVYDYLFPPQNEDAKYSLRNVVQKDATEILYNDVKELVEEAEKVEEMVQISTEKEHLEYLEGIRNRIELILNIFTSSVGNPVKRNLGFRTIS